jgi:glycosyltransferase involved in cell wall biosynthesis
LEGGALPFADHADPARSPAEAARGRLQFNPQELYRRFDFKKYDVDILFLNQPETAPAFLQFFNRQMFHNVPAVSYVHWFDIRRPSTPKQRLHLPALLAGLSGMIVSSAVGCNSSHGRSQILKQAAHWFKPEAIDDLRGRMRILPPPVDARQLRPRTAKPPRRLVQILVNHRLLKYTGVRNLLTNVFPQLWNSRRDFRVVATNPSRVRLPGTITDAPWLTMKTLDRPKYVRLLWQSDIVVAPHRSTHWSVSTLEAICADCVPLMNSESFFREMFEPILRALPTSSRDHVLKRWFYFRGNVVNRLNGLIENIEEERKLARLVGRHARRAYDWDTWTDAWLLLFREAEANIPVMAERNPSMLKIINLLHNGPVCKDEILRTLRWSPKQRALSWTCFRKLLRAIAPDDSGRPEVVFKLPHDDVPLVRKKKARRSR